MIVPFVASMNNALIENQGVEQLGILARVYSEFFLKDSDIADPYSVSCSRPACSC